jgi:hypothetical protein
MGSAVLEAVCWVRRRCRMRVYQRCVSRQSADACRDLFPIYDFENSESGICGVAYADLRLVGRSWSFQVANGAVLGRPTFCVVYTRRRLYRILPTSIVVVCGF